MFYAVEQVGRHEFTAEFYEIQLQGVFRFCALQWWVDNHSEELLAEEALQGVCVRRKNAGKKHGGCSSRRMNIWLWLSHRSSSNTNW